VSYRRRALRALTAAAALPVLLCLVPIAPAGATPSTGEQLLAKLSVRAESHNSTYARTRFKHWSDLDGDGCKTRDQVLIAESTIQATVSTRCNVTAGRWVSWYDDTVWTDDADVDIDHVVALAEAWGSGAWDWTGAKRERFANDLAFAWSLDAVTDNLNQSKGSRDPADWLPPRHTCKYARHWVAIKYRWRLSINTAEHTALAGILDDTCGDMEITVPKRAT
jgi:hypothetical protein